MRPSGPPHGDDHHPATVILVTLPAVIGTRPGAELARPAIPAGHVSAASTPHAAARTESRQVTEAQSAYCIHAAHGYSYKRLALPGDSVDVVQPSELRGSGYACHRNGRASCNAALLESGKVQVRASSVRGGGRAFAQVEAREVHISAPASTILVPNLQGWNTLQPVPDHPGNSFSLVPVQ